MNISLVNLLFASLGMCILFKFVLLPFTAKMAEKDTRPSALKKYIIRNIVDFGGLFFLLTTVSSGISWVIVKIINIKGGTTLEEVKKSLESVREIESITSTLSSDWAITTTVLLAGVLIIIAYKSTKTSFNEKVSDALSGELERLQKEFDEGKWKDLPPTEEMGQVYELIQEYSAKIEEIESNENSEEELSALNALIENKDKLVAYLEQLDIQRRINIEIEKEAYAKPESLRDRILLFFVSQGLINTFKKGGAILFIVGVLLLIPSILSIGSIIINNNAEIKIASLDSEVERLELEFQSKEIADEFDNITTIQKDGTNESISDEDEQVLNELSKVFENNIIESRTVGRASVNFARTSRITNYSVRSSILDHFSTSDNKVKVHKSEAIPGIVNDAVELEKKAIIDNKPVTNLGQRIKDDLRTIATNDKKLWSHYKKLAIDATKSFQVPASTRSVKGMMISNVVGHFAQGVEVPGVAGKLIVNMAKIPSDVAEQFYLNESKRYMLALAKAEHLSDVVTKVGEVRYRALPSQHIEDLKVMSNKIPEEGRLSKLFMENPPSLSRAAEPHVQIRKAQDTIRNIAKANSSLSSQTFADALSSFGDYFPGYEGEERKTAKGKTTSSSLSSTRYTSSKNASVRARSYTRLRGFSRIGGVLIGRMPTGEEILDVIDFNWKKVGDKFSISLTLKNGKSITIGKFDPAILYLALGYAADGRVTTVTMVSSSPLYDLRILLHPTLVDTGLGCRAIRLDQVADETTSVNVKLKKLRESENSKISSTSILYGFTWAVRLKQISDNDQEIAEQITDYLSYAKEIISEYAGEVKTILNGKNYNFDFISSKSDFYDENLVEIISRCEKSEGFKKCIEENLPISVSTSNPTWLYPPPKTTEWSGVREREYIMDKNLNFLLASQHDELWPFRFMVQTVFTSTPEFAENKENYSDSNPWEFESVNQLLMNEIENDLSRNLELKSLLKDMREFAILQRLFRLALNDKFGEEFPLQKLSVLTKEAKPHLSGHPRTLRWLPKPGVLDEQMAMLEVAKDGDMEKAKKILTLQKQLRAELGIYKDEEQIRNDNGKECPKP